MPKPTSDKAKATAQAEAKVGGIPLLVGIDTGGTFTDLIALHRGAVHLHKVLSTPDDPSRAVLEGLDQLLATFDDGMPRPTPNFTLTYSSTVATNALLEHKGARVALLTTAGFEDIIEISRQNRPDLYALEPQRAEPLVARRQRIGVRERMLFDGSALQRLSASEVQRVTKLARRNADAVAICLLHSYANPAHEQQLAAALRRHDIFVSVSSELVAEYREFERGSTTVINAYIGPVMSRHLERLAVGLGKRRWFVLQSNGGAITPALAAHEAVRTCLSGPAGGVRGAWHVAQALGLDRVITFDMGGTSSDVSLLSGDMPLRHQWEIGGHPVKVPALDIHTVGAGGGSLAYVDAGGALKVGPESAGADPGPACYGRGTRATVTDANAVLQRLAADNFLGGRMKLHVDRSRKAIAALARQIGLGVEATAEGIVRVVNAGMERALRQVSVERGVDPREHALIAFGGAGGQHACDLAELLGMTTVVIPRHPGVLSALGAASADIQRDYVRTLRWINPTTARLRAAAAPLIRRARRDMREQTGTRAKVHIRVSLDMRYIGQAHELAIPLRANPLRDFHSLHERRYGYADRQRDIEVVSLRLSAAVPRPVSGRATALVAIKSAPTHGRVRWHNRWWPTQVIRRDSLVPGKHQRGPLLVTEFSATTFVPPGWRLTLGEEGHLVLRHPATQSPFDALRVSGE